MALLQKATFGTKLGAARGLRAALPKPASVRRTVRVSASREEQVRGGTGSRAAGASRARRCQILLRRCTPLL